MSTCPATYTPIPMLFDFCVTATIQSNGCGFAPNGGVEYLGNRAWRISTYSAAVVAFCYDL